MGSITVRVNGVDVGFDGGVTVARVVADSGYDRTRVAVELNGDICPKRMFDDVVLKDGDRLEIVGFVGGG